MRILHLNDRFGTRGGADWHLLGILSEQAKSHEVVVAAGRKDPDADPAYLFRAVDGLDSRTETPVELSTLFAEVNADIIHVHNVVNPVALAQAADQGAVMTVQDHRSFCPGRGKLTLKGSQCQETMEESLCADCFDDAGYAASIWQLTRARLAQVQRMRRVIVLSAYMKQELVAVGVPDSNVHIVPPFVHGLDHAASAVGPPCVLFVGRLVDHKGVGDAIAAWRESGVDLPLVFAGTGPARARLEAEGFQCTGWLDHRKLSAIYRQARLVIIPSRWQEPFGIVGLEAATMGVPVLCWDSGGIEDWYQGPKIPWGDTGTLAAEIRRGVAEELPVPAPPPGAEPMMKLLETAYG
ncbi:MAG: hypothetical protein CMH54_14910 [Myxococcales bacterium]|nr:hypothetical protein [Myxococcales bacterium]